MADKSAPFQLPPLPWPENALDPVISANTLSFHYGKHHRAYVNKLNELVQGSRFADMSLEQVVKESAGKEQKIFNNAAQAWNHTFYWNCMKKGAGKPSGTLAARIESDCGGYDAFKKKFAETAVNCFGSGWAWLIAKDGKLDIVATANAATPIAQGQTPILTLDVWEHAYYLDYQNRRPDYAAAVIDKLLNWDFAAEQFDKSAHRKAA